MKSLLPSRVFLILSILWLMSLPVSAFFQNATAKVKTKYEFTDTRISEADTLLKKRKYPEALEAYQKAYDTFEEESFYEGMVYAKEREAFCERRKGNDSRSRKFYKESIELAKRFLPSNHLLLAKCYSNNGRRAYGLDNFVEASVYMDSSLVVVDRSSWTDSALLRSIIEFKFYTRYYAKGNKDSLLSALNRRGEFFDLYGSSLSQNAILLWDYSKAFYAMNDFQKSVAYALEGIVLCESKLESINKFIYTNLLFSLGRSLNAQKRHKQALSNTEKLIEFTLKYDPLNRELRSYINLKAVILNGMGRFDEASEQFALVIRLLEEKKTSSEFYRDAVMNLGVAFQKKEEYEISKSHLDRALKLEQKDLEDRKESLDPKENSRFPFAKRYRYIGQWYHSQKMFTEALVYYDSSLRSGIRNYNGKLLDPPRRSGSDLSFNTLLTLKSKQITLEELYTNEEVDSSELLFSAVRHAEITHSYLMQNRLQLQASEGRLFLSDNFKNLYESALNSLYMIMQSNGVGHNEMKSVVKFFSLSKANLFLEQSGELGSIQNPKIPREIKNQYYRMKTKVDSLESELNSIFDQVEISDKIRRVNSEMLRLDSRLEKLRDSIELKFDLEVNDQNGQINQYSKLNAYVSKNPHKAIVDFFVGERFIFALLISKGKTSLKRIELTELFKSNFKWFIKEITQPPELGGYDERLLLFQEKSFELFEFLMKDIVADISNEVTEITLIPDEQLSKLPFEVLVSSRSVAPKSFKDLAFLIRRFTVNYSLSLLEVTRPKTINKSVKKLLGIGYSGDVTSSTRALAGALPGTEEEIKYLKANVDGDFYLGNVGTKKKFLEVANKYDILHLAVHGRADSLDRYQSQLIFNGSKDNILKASDLYVADINARLAILSACESGIGEINRGEGMFSLGRGFALVGVPSVVMSLWKVNDEVTSSLMVSFHESLGEGNPTNLALSTSKLDYLNNADKYTSHPYYWSAFISLGEEITFRDGKKERNWIIVTSVALLIILSVISMKSKKKKRGIKPLL